MIEVEHLSKRYGSVRAVHDLSFQVAAGQVVGFLGPNGAGKSTTLRILAGFTGASAGRARVAGHDVALERRAARRAIGYMPESCPLYPEMRVGEYLRFRTELKGVRRRRRLAEVDRALEQAGAADVVDVVIGHLSKGYRQRVGLADALLGRPPLLILDEPTAGLDPNQIREVRALLRSLAPEHTVLLSTHILSEVQRCCDRAVVIAGGRLVAEGTVDELRRRQQHQTALELCLRGDEAAVLSALRSVEGTGQVTLVRRRSGSVLDVEVRRATASHGAAESGDPVGELAERAVAALVEVGIAVRRIAPIQSSLEQVFSELTGTSDVLPLPPSERSATADTGEREAP